MASEGRNVNVQFGGGIGSALAAILSYVHNHSIMWAILHFFCSWLYVAYAVLTRTALAGLIH